MFKELDPILHAPLRLAVVSLLLGVKEAEFTFIKEKTNSTAGNLSGIGLFADIGEFCLLYPNQQAHHRKAKLGM